MRVLITLLCLALLLPVALADDEPARALRWEHQGFAALAKAAQEAKRDEKRVLVGLSGGST